MEKKISVIIPVYNVEKYLRECLDSVADQSLKDIEIICVNDGSTDSSRDILLEFKEKDSRFIVLDKQNGGLSSARNAGFAAAKGTYILFLDSDDILKGVSALEKLYERAEKDRLDDLFYDADVFFENESIKLDNKNYINYYKRRGEYPGVIEGKELFVAFQENRDYKPHACLQLLRRAFLSENHILFTEGYVHEDHMFTAKCITFAKRAGYLAEAFYGRRIRENSIMTVKRKVESICSLFYAVKEMLDFANTNVVEENDSFRKCFYERIFTMLEQQFKMYQTQDEEERKEVLKRIPEEDKALFWVFLFYAEQVHQDKDAIKKAEKTNKKISNEQNKIVLKLQAACEENKKFKEEIQQLQNKLKKSQTELDRAKEEVKKAKREEARIRSSASFRVGKTVTWVPRKIKKVFRQSEAQPQKQNSRNVWLVGTPEFGNLGDHMISEAEREILRTVYPEKNIHEITMNEYWEKKDYLKNTVQKNDLLVFHGGGNVGNLWPKSEQIRRDAFGIWKDQKKIIMPQSICFTDDEEGRKELEETRRSYAVKNLLLCCRDAASYQFAEEKLPCASICVPDTVLFHKPETHPAVRKEGAVLCLRSDKEKTVTEQDKEKIVSALRKKYTKITELDTVGEKKTRETRREGLKEFFDQLRRAEIVVTDRLHGMIFCALNGVPCIALDNSYHKVSGAYEWLKPLEYIHYIKDVSELDKWIEYDWKDNYQYPYEKYREKFKALMQKLS